MSDGGEGTEPEAQEAVVDAGRYVGPQATKPFYLEAK